MPQHRTYLYPECAPRREGFLDVTRKHTLYWEESGNPHGKPVLFLHSGLDAHCFPLHRRLFDPEHYRIISFDQRGCGRSTPLGCLDDNTPQDTLQDIEALRIMLHVEKWHILGGSWGAALALSYAQSHPERVSGLILHGLSALSREEIDWMVSGVQLFAPEAYHHFVALLTPEERCAPLGAYAQRLASPDPVAALAAAHAWTGFRDRIASSGTKAFPMRSHETRDDALLAYARVEAHIFCQRQVSSETLLLRGIDKIRHIPAILIHGQHDIVCPLKTAYSVHSCWPEAELRVIPDAGHALFSPRILMALLAATEEMKYRETPCGIYPIRPPRVRHLAAFLGGRQGQEQGLERKREHLPASKEFADVV